MVKGLITFLKVTPAYNLVLFLNTQHTKTTPLKTQDAYNNWAKTYDTVVNKTRDLEGIVIRTVLENLAFGNILELGCGTGKNTTWLEERCEHLVAADFSEEMLVSARQKIVSPKVEFLRVDITQPWNFEKMHLITCSLVLEHIENLDFIMEQAVATLQPNGLFYICELHPYKQLQGSRAKFLQNEKLFELEYFLHHISHYFGAATKYGLVCQDLQEWFDSDNPNETPRLISFVFKKK